MSEQVKTPLPGEVTGNEAVDAEAVIQKRIADAVTAYEASQKARGGTLTEGDIIRLLGQGGGTGVNESTKPAPIKAFGQEFESPEALEAAVKAHIATLQAPPVQQQQVTQPQAAGFDEKQFTSLLDQPNGTPKALEYALRHSGIYQEIETLKAANQALRMKETAREVKELVPGFTPKNPQEVALIDQIRQQMGGAPDNPIAWEGAVTLAAKRGLIKLDGPTAPNTPRGTAVAPPYTGPSSASDSAQEELMSRAWNLPLHELEKLRSDIAAAKGR